MSQVSSNGFYLNDIVSYKYNGMSGRITQIISETHLEVTFPSSNRSSGVLVVTLSVNEIELVSGGSATSTSSELVSA